MEFIMENYLIIILVGIFFVFALIGYLIDMARKPKNDETIIPKEIEPIKVTKIEQDEENVENKEDELLENYDNLNMNDKI